MTKPCQECGEAPKAPRHPLWCAECRLRHQPMAVQIEAATARLEAVAAPLRRRTVPPKEWPTGRRWCSGCQTMRSFRDYGRGGGLPTVTRCRPCHSQASHAQRLKAVYGIDPAEYLRLTTLQGGLCAICRQGQRYQRLTVDHDHKTGQVRGLLCQKCNHRLLGAAHESVRILANAVLYLTTPPAGGLWSDAADPLEITVTRRSAVKGSLKVYSTIGAAVEAVEARQH